MLHNDNMTVGQRRQDMIQAETNQGVVFEDHIPIKERMKEQLKFKSSGKPKTNMVTAAVLSSSTARQTTEELLELLSSAEGQHFVRVMAGACIDGYLDAAGKKRFLEANQNAGEHVLIGGAKAVQKAIDSISPMPSDMLARYKWPVAMAFTVPVTIVMLALLRFIFFGLDPIFGGR